MSKPGGKFPLFVKKVVVHFSRGTPTGHESIDHCVHQVSVEHARTKNFF